MVTYLFDCLVCFLLDSQWSCTINCMAMRCRYYGKLVWKGRVSHDGDDLDSVFTFDISRGLIFGIWSACASVGNIIGAALAAAFIQYGYEYPFLVCCILLIACAIICFFAIVPSPDDVGSYSKQIPRKIEFCFFR